MKKTLEQVIDILKSSKGIVIENCYSKINIDGDSINVKFYSGNGEWNDKFYFKDNSEVLIIGSSIFLTDEDGDQIQIIPLFTKDLEAWI